VGENRIQNQQLVDTLASVARERNLTASQLAIAWVLSKGPAIVPVIGARTRVQLKEALGALEVQLTAEELSRIEAALSASQVAGTRYDEHQMKVLDSER
jgi:aryl-alcohol dehydrogenase-like predicted oxidoreductase